MFVELWKLVTDLWQLLEDNHDSLEVFFWIAGLLTVLTAYKQVSDAFRQRNLSESLNLFDRLDADLAEWSSAHSCIDTDPQRFRKSVGRLFATYEILCTADNRDFLAPMARKILHGQILDSVEMVLSDWPTVVVLKELFHREGICTSLRIFLIKNRQHVLKLPGFPLIAAALYRPMQYALFYGGGMAWWQRGRQIAKWKKQ